MPLLSLKIFVSLRWLQGSVPKSRGKEDFNNAILGSQRQLSVNCPLSSDFRSTRLEPVISDMPIRINVIKFLAWNLLPSATSLFLGSAGEICIAEHFWEMMQGSGTVNMHFWTSASCREILVCRAASWWDLKMAKPLFQELSKALVSWSLDY